MLGGCLCLVMPSGKLVYSGVRGPVSIMERMPSEWECG